MGPRTRREWWIGLALGLLACAGKGTDGDITGSAGGGDAEEDTGAAPLDNGPGGGLVMVQACAPDGGPAYSLLIGLGNRCDMAAPAADEPYVQLIAHDASFVARPVDNEISWTGSAGATATFAPEGRVGPAYSPSAGGLYLSEWDGVDSGRPEGGGVSGWYVLLLDDGREVGASFTGAWCGGDPDCG